MLSAIDLDDEPCLRAEEIGDIRPDLVLATEAESFELLASHPRSHPDLGIRWRKAQFARE